MKTIVRITLSSMEVDDEYVLKERNDPDEDVIVSEHDGYVFIGGDRGGEPIFISLDPGLRQITPLMQFTWWATVGWQGFQGALPSKLKQWFSWFNSVKDMPVWYANEMMKKRLARLAEVESRQIKFEHWDAELFGDPATLHSVN